MNFASSLVSVLFLSMASVTQTSAFLSYDEPHSHTSRQPHLRLHPFDLHFNPLLSSSARYAQFRPRQLSLKPLFFEVPQQEQDPLFLGRHWLFAELSDALLNSPSRGCLLTGGVGTGKTAAILQMVEHSCFGRRASRDEPLYSGERNRRWRIKRNVDIRSFMYPSDYRNLGKGSFRKKRHASTNFMASNVLQVIFKINLTGCLCR